MGRYATEPPPRDPLRLPVEDVLDEPHCAAFRLALANLLSTEIAEITFAQIIDGLPLARVAFSTRGHRDKRYDPVAQHTELCPGVLESTRAFRDAFDATKLALDADVSPANDRPGNNCRGGARLTCPLKVLRRYQSVPVASRAARPRLVEITAVAVHAIASLLFELDESRHKGTALTGEPPPSSDDEDDVEEDEDDDDDDGAGSDSSVPSSSSDGHRIKALPPFPTPFTLSQYSDPAQYPDGVAALPGYWAEDQVFGGVVLFDRTEGSPSATVWFHSFRDTVTRRIYALTEPQQAALVGFLQGGAGDGGCPLPILADATNRERVDADIAIPERNIFRDRWERKITVASYEEYVERHERDVLTAVDYPELADRG